MRPKSIIHLVEGEKIKTPDHLEQLIANLDRLQPGGTLAINRLTDHGALKKVYVTRPAIVRIEDA